MAQKWRPEDWRAAPIVQQPNWPNAESLAETEKRLMKSPPLVFAGEARSLRARLAERLLNVQQSAAILTNSLSSKTLDGSVTPARSHLLFFSKNLLPCLTCSSNISGTLYLCL